MGKGWKGPIKEAIAAKRGQMFTKLAREVSVAAKLGGPDPAGNSRLKLAIERAKAAQCPKDTIERAIKKGSGQLEGGAIEELVYEGFGPHKVGVIVICQSDNKVRTVSEIRQLFKASGGMMGENGSVAWMFKPVSIVIGKKAGSFDPEEEAIEAGANEVQPSSEDNQYEFFGEVNDVDAISKALTARGWEINTAEQGFKASNITELNDDQTKEVHEFLRELDDNDDTYRIFASI